MNIYVVAAAALPILTVIIVLTVIAVKNKNIIAGQDLHIESVHKQVEDARKSVEYDLMKYKLTSDALNIALWDMDVISEDPVNPSNKFKWSQELRLMLGFTNERDFPNLLHSWSDRLHPEDKERSLRAFAAHIMDHSGQTPYDIEYRLMTKNGEYRDYRAFGATLRDSDGVPLRVAGALQDITEKKRMDKQIVEMNANLNLVLDTMPVGVRIVRFSDGELVYANKASMDVFGCEDFERDVAGKSAFDFMPEVQPDGRLTTEVAAEFFQLDRVPTDFQCFKLNGELFTARITSCNVNYKDSLSSLAIIEDITAAKEMEDALQKALEESNRTRDIMTSILNKTDIMTYVTDAETNEILFINEMMKSHFRLDSSVIGKLCHEIFQESMGDRCDFCPCHKLDKDPDSVIIWEDHNIKTGRIYRKSDQYASV